MSMYEQMSTTKQSNNYVYIGAGDYVVSVLEIKHDTSRLKFIVEVKVEQVISGNAHVAGDNVSWMVNYGGNERDREMGLKNVRQLNDALIASAGGNAATWTAQQWEDFGARCGKNANINGIKLRAKVAHYTKSDGSQSKIPRVSWFSVGGQPRRPELVDVYGASASAPKPAGAQPPRSGPPKPGAPAKHPMHAECVDALRGFLAAGEPTGPYSDIHKWAIGEGMTDAQYAAALAEAGGAF